eukprot:TRINITY_DN14145_c0_g1_i4.p2 TRINITY_DN14145_c0_g1~~TRINITY_DN14145_c0_g1_i4.p2  ORF type:complete len:123 (+),score=9.95 TRINITY_DN14145_c0_g1_i4:35-370(+)
MGTNYAFYDGALLGMFILTAATLLGVSHVVAPYGRHFSNNWGPTLPSRLGWIVMESPPVWFGPLVFFSGQNSANFTSIVLIGLATWPATLLTGWLLRALSLDHSFFYAAFA